MAKSSGSLRKRKRRGTGNAGVGSSGLSLTTVSIVAFSAFSVILVAAVFFAQLDTQLRLNNLKSSKASVHAEGMANKFASLIGPYIYTLQTLSNNPDLQELITDGSHIAQQLKAQELKSYFKGALHLRLIKDGTQAIDKSTVPHLGYACLDMINIAGKDKTISPLEVHAVGTGQEHIDLVESVVSRSGKLLGYMQLTLDVKLIQAWLDKIAMDSYIELRQNIGKKDRVYVARAGDKENVGKGDRSGKVIVPGTNFTIVTWKPTGLAVSEFNAGMFAAMAIGIILAGLVVWLLRRAMSNAIRFDIENLLQFTIATFRGNKQHEYSMQMREFKLAALRIDELMSQQPVERERDSDPSSVNIMRDLPDLDSSLVSNSSVSVEEIDSSAYMAARANQSTQSAQIPQSASQQIIAEPIQNDSNAPTMPPPEIFKAYDIRGIVGRTLTAHHATLIGRALGSEAVARGLKKIVFARDGRLSGPELGQALVIGLRESGMDVIDIGMVPTPVLYFAAAEGANGTGVMLTGSHNPPDYNGFKMVLGGETLAAGAIQDLRKRIENNDFTSGQGKYETAMVADRYINRIVGDVNLKRKLRIAIDCGNGVAGVIAPKLFRALGCDVTELYCEVDGKFPNHHPDPSKPANLTDLIEMVTSKRVDVGLAFDGDGDRLGVISPDGEIIWPDRLMILFAEDVLSRNHGAQIIYDIKCSSNLTQAIWEKGGEPLMWKTGHSLIKAKMRESGALLAGEMSGHIFFKERWYGFDDGLYSGARLLEILAGETRTPKQVFGRLPNAVNTPEINIQMQEGEHHRFVDTLMDQADFGDANVTMIDGVRVDYADGWGLVRASNTTPVLVLRFEGKDKAAMERIQEVFRKVLLAVEPGLKIPF